MMKFVFASAAFVTFCSAAAADPSFRNTSNPFSNRGVSSVEGAIDATRTRSATHTLNTRDVFENYSGIGTYTSARHGGSSDIRTSGKAGAVSLGLNASSASANGAQRSIDLSAGVNGATSSLGSTIGNMNVGLGVTGLEASTSSVSGSGLLAGASNGGSLTAHSAGYAAGSAVAQREWGNSHTRTEQNQWNTTSTLNASGILSRTR